MLDLRTFDLNLLVRANRELEADFALDAFAHRAVWNDAESRIEMRLESLKEQGVRVAGRRFAFAAGETIHTENSYKYEEAALERLAAASGWRLMRRWTAPEPYSFALMLLQG